MPDENQSFAGARVRLEEIVSQVRKKDTSLEKSLDLLEEGVRLANQCTELIDHADWEFAGPGTEEGVESDGSAAEAGPASVAGDTTDESSDEAATSTGEAADQTASDMAEATGEDVEAEADDDVDDESDNEDA